MNLHRLLRLTLTGFAGLFLSGLAAAAESIAPANYTLRTGDSIALTVFQEPDLATETRISADGSARFPLIGIVQVAGKTLSDVHGEIIDLYGRDYLVNPQLSIVVTEYAQSRVRVRGKVNRPGFVVIPPEETFTLLDVVSAAGDTAPSGNERKVELHRADASGRVVVSVIDLTATSGANAPSAIIMQDNDTVVVPERMF